MKDLCRWVHRLRPMDQMAGEHLTCDVYLSPKDEEIPMTGERPSCAVCLSPEDEEIQMAHRRRGKIMSLLLMLFIFAPEGLPASPGITIKLHISPLNLHQSPNGSTSTTCRWATKCASSQTMPASFSDPIPANSHQLCSSYSTEIRQSVKA